jgi:hypothetical protein
MVEEMPDNGVFADLKNEVYSLLVLSDLVCEKAQLVRYQTGLDEVVADLDLSALPSAEVLARRVLVSFEELSARGVRREHLRRFVFSTQNCGLLATQHHGLSDLERRPLLAENNMFIVALPTAISTALRDRVIDFAFATEQIEALDAQYATQLSRRIAATRLLGVGPGFSVEWNRAGQDQIATCVAEFDRGHFIALHFLLPSVATHQHGRFKWDVPASEKLAEALSNSIAGVTAYFGNNDSFHAGLHIVVVCGWGKGMFLQTLKTLDARWRLDAVSLADIVRLSNIESMTISRFWRLSTAVQSLRDAGVEIENVNGVANLMGWLELNDGHLVPHASLGRARILPDSPLRIVPPLNLLRTLRAKADQSTD